MPERERSFDNRKGTGTLLKKTEVCEFAGRQRAALLARREGTFEALTKALLNGAPSAVRAGGEHSALSPTEDIFQNRFSKK